MACTVQTEGLDTLESLLDCNICFEHYDDSDHVPIMFGCQHTVCKACLKDLLETHSMEDKFPCPVCREEVEIKPDGVKGFSKNRILLDILHQKKSKVKCKEHPQKTVSHYCITCAKSLCSTCVIRLVKDHSGHRIEDIEDTHTRKDTMVAVLKTLANDIDSQAERIVIQEKKLKNALEDSKKQVARLADEAVAHVRDEQRRLERELTNLYKGIIESDNDEDVDSAFESALLNTTGKGMDKLNEQIDVFTTEDDFTKRHQEASEQLQRMVRYENKLHQTFKVIPGVLKCGCLALVRRVKNPKASPACRTPHPGGFKVAKEDAAKAKVEMRAPCSNGYTFGNRGSGNKPGKSFSYQRTPKNDETKDDSNAEAIKPGFVGTTTDKTPQSSFRFGSRSFGTQPPAPAASSAQTSAFNFAPVGSDSSPSFAFTNVSGSSIMSAQYKSGNGSDRRRSIHGISSPSKPTNNLGSLVAENNFEEADAPKFVLYGVTFSSISAASLTELENLKKHMKTDLKSFTFGTSSVTAPKSGRSSGAIDLTDNSKGNKATAMPTTTPFGGSASAGNLLFAAVATSAAAEGDEDNDDTDDEEVILFEKRVTLFIIDETIHKSTPRGMGDLLITEDLAIVGHRIAMINDAGKKLCSHLICKSYQLSVNPSACYAEWSAKDFVTDQAIEQVFGIQFMSKSALEEFKQIFSYGVAVARDIDTDEVTEIPRELFT